MEEIKLTPEELKEAIDFGKLIGSGFFSSVFTYKGRLIKLKKPLYDLLKVNLPSFSRKVIECQYRWEVEDFNRREQLEELARRQHLIRPRVPEGIVTLKDVSPKIDGVSPGIIIPPFEGYRNLSAISKNDYKTLLILFRKIFDDIKNLADNEIAQEDLLHSERKKYLGAPTVHKYNIVQNGEDVQIIDMSGPFVKVGKEYSGPDLMYAEFAKLMDDYYRNNGYDSLYQKGMSLKEDDLSRMIAEFDKCTRGK